MKSTSYPLAEARLGIMLNELRLPTIKTFWPRFVVVISSSSLSGRKHPIKVSI